MLATAALSMSSKAEAAADRSAKSAFFKTSDGVRIHYLDVGAGRPIVFIPGWTMPAWIWQKQIDALSKKYRVIAVDPRSQGESDQPTYGHLPQTRARDYKELVDRLDLKAPVLVSWSMACGELLKYVEQFGTENVGGLALVDGLLYDKPSPQMFTMVSPWMNQLQQDRRKQADGFVRSLFKKPQPEEYLQRVVEASVRVPADTAVALIYNMIAVPDFTAAFARIDRPVLFMFQPDTQPSADLLKSRLGSRVRLERFDGAGHALFVDEPDRFNRVLEDFVESLPK
jgi:microsomal epoxide hydrolase